MTFKKKLVVAFCVMAALPLAVIGAQAFWNVRQQRVGLRRLQLSLLRARIFDELESSTYRKIRKIRDYVSGQDPAAKDEFRQLDALCRSKLAEWKAATADRNDLALVRSFEERDEEVVALAGHVFSLCDEGKREQATRLVQEDLNHRLLPALDGVIKTIYAGARTRNIERALSDAASMERSTTLVLVFVLVACAAFSALFSVMLARNLARPFELLKAMMDRVGEGDFDRAQALDVSGKDEIGDLARAFVRMSERLQRAQEELRHKIDTLRDTQSQLIQSEKLASLGQMAAAVAHGLRNPLASIRAATQLTLSRLPSESPLREQLTAVIEEVDRLEKRILHLLDFTRPVAFAPAPTSVQGLVEGVVAVFGEKISKQGVHLAVGFDPSLPEAWVDAAQVEQAIIEVMANALEAMPDGGSLAVAVRSPASEGDAGALRLTIEDTGEGISAQDLARVTEPFFTTKADGTGLGLAIAKRFVVQNGGDFVISSAGQEGTVVTVTLPAVGTARESGP